MNKGQYRGIQIFIWAWLALCLNGSAWAAQSSSTSLSCSPSTGAGGAAVINEVNSSDNFVEIYLLKATSIANWALYLDSNKMTNLGAGNCSINGTTTADSTATYPAGTFIYCHDNLIASQKISNASNEVLLVDKTGTLTSGDTTVIDYLSYYVSNSVPNNLAWTVPTGSSGCGATYSAHSGSNKDIARIPDGTGALSDNGNASTPGTSNSGTPSGGGGASSFDAVEKSASQVKNIYTKLISTAFTLDILAFNSGSLLTSYSNTPTVTLVDGSTGSGLCGNMTALSGTTITAGSWSSGRNTYTFTVPQAAANVRVRVTDGSVTSCSSDNFAIRPKYFNSVSSSATQSLSSGTPILKAGADSFTLTVTTGESGYTGIPKISAVDAHSGAIATGTVSGSFSAASSGSASGTNFTYSEVGNFRFLGYDPASDSSSARGIYDDTFTSLDQTPGDCVSGSYSNVLSGGKYGCLIGLYDQGTGSPNSVYFGRFVPNHFLVSGATLTNRADTSCSSSTFTYMDEPVKIAFTLSALNSAGNATKNYTGSYAKLSPSTSTWISTGNGTMGLWALATGYASGSASGCKAVFTSAGATTFACTTGSLSSVAASSARVSVSSSASLPSSLNWSNGTGTATVYPILGRGNAPDGPYSTLAFGILPKDSDGVTLQSSVLDMDADNDGTKERQILASSSLRYGRLWMGNAFGSSTRSLMLSYETQYWTGLSFIKNTLDSCTTLSTSNIGKGNYHGNLTSSNVGTLTIGIPSGTTCTSASSSSQVSAGGGCLVMTAPSVSGSVDLTTGLGASATANICATSTPSTMTGANLAYLRGGWCIDTHNSYDRDPTARATFGVFGSSAKKGVIYLREGY